MQLSSNAGKTEHFPAPSHTATLPPGWPVSEHPGPPHPASLPQPMFHNPVIVQQDLTNQPNLERITEIVRDASSILGLGPICDNDIDNAAGDTFRF